jgi:hypothetical protein
MFYSRSKVFIAGLLNVQVFWDVTPCPVIYTEVSKCSSAYFFRVKHSKKSSQTEGLGV